MKKRIQNLTLSKETVRILNGDLQTVVGGTCWSAGSDCPEMPWCQDQQGQSANGC